MFLIETELNILLTNDDGWNAPGLAALQRVAGRWGRVVTVAPSQQQSGISHQLTFHRPVKLVEQSVDQYALDGTPADCVRIGLTQLGVPFDWRALDGFVAVSYSVFGFV